MQAPLRPVVLNPRLSQQLLTLPSGSLLPDRESELQLVLETADFAEVVTAEHTCSDDESSNLTSTGE